MRLRELRQKYAKDHINEIVITGKILSNKDSVDFGESIYAIHSFSGDSLVPLVIESSTTCTVETDDGFEDTKKNLFNVNLYGDLINKVTDNEDFYVGSRVRIKGYLISKNFAKIEEKKDIMNICNRYKNLTEGERPLLYEGDKVFTDKETGIDYTKYFIDWNLLLNQGLLETIPDEELQDSGRVEYFYIEDGRVYRQENKTNYIIIAKDIEAIDGFLDINKGDENTIEITGTTKNIYVNDYEGYQTGHICLICKTKEMTRNSYIHVILKAKSLEALSKISIEDVVKVKGKLKHKVKESEIIKKKGKKEIVIKKHINIYEIDCRQLEIYKNI